MGLRNLLGCSLAVLLLSCAEANYRQRRQSPETTFYQPPLLLNSAPQPAIPQHNSYQPPIPRQQEHQPQPANSFKYRSPLEYSSPGHQSAQIVPHDSSQSFSVHQQPSSERTSKVVGSSASVQAIHKAPAWEIIAKEMTAAKEKDAAKDEYVVYYYYYYDNDTAANGSNNNNLSSLNFDDIPSLESFDDAKEPERIQTNLGNALDDSRNASASLQARSASSSQANDAFIRADRPQPLKPVSNVFRYGSNEVPRFPVLPNFVVSEVSTTTTTEGPTPQSFATSESPTTISASNNPEAEEDDAVNSVLDNATDLKEAKSAEVEETTTTTTTEPPTTTEEDTTTTERPSRRRPSIGGSRRRFNPNPSSASLPSNRGRNPPSRSTSSTSLTSTTTSATPTRRSFQGSNRIRSRPPIGGSSRSRTTDNEDRPPSRSTTESTTTTSTTARARFTSAAPRRFQSSRSRSQASSSTTSTSTTTRSPSGPTRSRPTSRPRPNLISRNRPPRPGFLRPRPEDTVETTTATPAEAEETSPSNEAVVASTAEEEDSEENEETSEEEEESEEQPTTTESNRFSALFRPRNRNALNRPRPVIGNRPSRS